MAFGFNPGPAKMRNFAPPKKRNGRINAAKAFTSAGRKIKKKFPNHALLKEEARFAARHNAP